MDDVAVEASWQAFDGYRLDGVAQSEGVAAVALSQLDGDSWRGGLEIVSCENLESRASVVLASGAADVAWCRQMIVLACDDGDVVCATAGGTVSGRLAEHDGPVASVAARDELASASTDGTLKLWDLERARSSRTIQLTGAATALAWVDASVVCCAADDGTVSTFDVRCDEPASIVRGGAVPTCALCLVGDRVVAGLEDGTLVVRDARDLSVVDSLDAVHQPGAPVCAITTSSSGLLATASDDCSVCLLDAATSKLVRRYMPLHSDYVRGLAFCEDSLLTAGWDGRLLLLSTLSAT